jgi:DNA-binding beta-propeller fold protein YncE
MVTPPQPQPRVRAPRLPADPALWLNVPAGEAPPTLARGTVTLLDFFSYGCLNCVHVQPDIRFLEEKYAGRPFRVVGVHSGKFPGEKGDASVRNAVQRLGITHPVVRDDDYALWRAFAVRAWPTFCLVDADGYLVLTVSGEGRRAELDAAVGELLGAGVAPAPALRAAVSPSTESAAPLLYPGKVLADQRNGRLFIADTGNGRVLVLPLAGSDGVPTAVYGGLTGPQGMALSADGVTLYVANAGAHRVCALDLTTGAKTTAAGTGRQQIGAVSGGPTLSTDLNSPWDLLFSPADPDTLFVAMAGSHQIAALDLRAGTVAVFAGSGREGRADGTAPEATFAQPSGLATDGARLFVADAESSCVRVVTLGPGPVVTTLAGGDLFDWGDADGAGDAARFQHPAGINYDADRGRLWVADAYNNSVRRLDPATGRVDTPFGVGGLYEPGGLSAAGDTLFVADTNHHRVVAFDLREGAPQTAPRIVFPPTT